MSATAKVSNSAMRATKSYDFVIIGSGAASVCAALMIREAGKTAIIIEKSNFFGGSTSQSDGAIWVPCNSVVVETGTKDSRDLASAYIDAVCGTKTAGSSTARRRAFLKFGPLAIDLLRFNGMKFVRALGFLDYHSDALPGVTKRGRAIVPAKFNLEELRRHQTKIDYSRDLEPMMAHERADLLTPPNALRGHLLKAKIGLRKLQVKFLRRKLVGCGRALQGRLLQIAMKNQLRVWLDSPVTGLMMAKGRVSGVTVMHEGLEVMVAARDGVLINSGGFIQNAELRTKWLGQAGVQEWAAAYPNDTGEVISMAMDLGAAVEAMDQTWSLPNSVPAQGGTSGGLLTDESARVIDTKGQPIPGLYAAGGAASSLFGSSCPGPGAHIGESIVFGYIAARHALQVSPL